MIHTNLYDHSAFDGDMADLYIDTANNEFYVSITGSGNMEPDSAGPFWHGPFAVAPPVCD